MMWVANNVKCLMVKARARYSPCPLLSIYLSIYLSLSLRLSLSLSIYLYIYLSLSICTSIHLLLFHSYSIRLSSSSFLSSPSLYLPLMPAHAHTHARTHTHTEKHTHTRAHPQAASLFRSLRLDHPGGPCPYMVRRVYWYVI